MKKTLHVKASSDLILGNPIEADITIGDMLCDSGEDFIAQVDAATKPFCEAVASELHEQILRTFAILRMSANDID